MFVVDLVPANVNRLAAMLKDVDTEWEELGSRLNVSKVVILCCLGLTDLLRHWLQFPHEPNWFQLANVLHDMGYTALCDQIYPGMFRYALGIVL